MAEKILIVDDDQRLVEMYSATLTGQGYEVKTALDGEEALAKITQEKPDLVILDIMMPKIHGVDTLDIIKATPEVSKIKILVLTAVSDDKIREKALALGASAFLVKSQCTMTEVMEKISDLLKKEN